jgi:hypothetical protein
LKDEPEAWLVTTPGVESHESEADTLKLTGIETAVVFAGSVTTMSAGQLMTGAMVSTTVTLRWAVAVLPTPSVAV